MSKIQEMLKYIDPSNLNYSEWIEVGMAIKSEGLDCDVWDSWSSNDPRYKPSDCFKRWGGFSGEGITGATITHLAKQGGWVPSPKMSFAEERVIGFDEELIIDSIQIVDVERPLYSDPAQQAIEFLKHAFKPGDLINVVTAAKWDEDRQKWFPGNAGFTQERDSIIERLKGGLDGFAGDRNKAAGVWIRVNPMDGKGIKNNNTAAFRHVLIESDEMSIEKQIDIYRRLELPITCLTLSGGKSVHALVKVDAKSADEYKERVKRLFQACIDQGLALDSQNRNPSRLCRFAGFERGDKEQSLLAVDIGSSSYEEWIENFVLDELPEYEDFADLYDNPPELPPETIRGVLRRGEKLVLTGPSKAGKSFALIQLAIALAKGDWWLGLFKCSVNRVVYINMELTKENATVRFLDVWNKVSPKSKEGLRNISIWNLRGTSVTTKSMVDSIIKRHKSMINPPTFYIIDPIYKINSGDENAAKDINELLREFDRLCAETNANLVYAHHHAKGSQFGKRALDRGSGSGVIGRDADAAIDLDFLFVPQSMKEEKASYYNDQSWKDATGLRVESTFRNFKSRPPFNVWFKYPIHSYDGSDEFQALRGESEKNGNAEKGKKLKKEATDKFIKQSLDELFEENETVRMLEAESKTNLSRPRIKEFIDSSDEYGRTEKGVIFRKVSVSP